MPEEPEPEELEQEEAVPLEQAEPEPASDLEEVVEQADESVPEEVADDVLLEEALEPSPPVPEPQATTEVPTREESTEQEPFAQDESPPPSEPVSQDEEVPTSVYAEELPPDFWDGDPAAPPADTQAPKPAPPPERYNPDAPVSEQLRQLFPGKVVRTEPVEAEKPTDEEFAEDAVQEGLFD